MEPGAGLGAYSPPLTAPRAVHVHPFEVTPPFFLKLFLALLCQPLQFPLGLWVTYTPMPCSDLWEAKGVIWVSLMPRCHNLPLPPLPPAYLGAFFLVLQLQSKTSISSVLTLALICKELLCSSSFLHWHWRRGTQNHFLSSAFLHPSSQGPL